MKISVIIAAVRLKPITGGKLFRGLFYSEG